MNLWSCGIIVTKRCRKKLSRLFPGKSTTVVPNSSYYYIIIIYSKVAFLEFWGCDFGSIFARKRSRLWNVSTTWPLLDESPEALATHPTVAALSKLQAKPPLRMPDNDVEVEKMMTFTKGSWNQTHFEIQRLTVPVIDQWSRSYPGSESDLQKLNI